MMNLENHTDPTHPSQQGGQLGDFIGLEPLEARLLMAGNPTLAPIADVTLLAGSDLHVALDGADPRGQKITYTARSTRPLVSTFIPRGNQALIMNVAGFGRMVFQLFNNRAPRPAGRISSLANQRFFDGVAFHRVINGFVIQGGDPTGTGSGGSALGDFDDQFHPDLQHNRTGLLSMAKSGDDTNDSQFFITEGSARHLDFNHSIFGLLIEGEAVREAISNVPTQNDQPIDPVVMTTVRATKDRQNGVLTLKAPEGSTGTSRIVVTATDTDGKRRRRRFTVTVVPDTSNGGPYLNPIRPVFSEQDIESTIQLSSVDVEGDEVFYAAALEGAETFDFGIDSDAGLVTYTPPAGFTGTLDLLVAVRAAAGSDTVDTFDTQSVPITILPPDAAGNTAGAARFLGPVRTTLAGGSVSELVGPDDAVDWYRMKIKKPGQAKIKLRGLVANADLDLFGGKANRPKKLASSRKPGTSPEKIKKTLSRGTHWLRVTSTEQFNTPYVLTLRLKSTRGGGAGAAARATSALQASAGAVLSATAGLLRSPLVRVNAPFDTEPVNLIGLDDFGSLLDTEFAVGSLRSL